MGQRQACQASDCLKTRTAGAGCATQDGGGGNTRGNQRTPVQARRVGAAVGQPNVKAGIVRRKGGGADGAIGHPAHRRVHQSRKNIVEVY